MAVAAPSGSKEQSVRDLAASTVGAVLNAIKEADIPKIIADLTEAQRSAEEQGTRGQQREERRGTRSRHSWIKLPVEGSAAHTLVLAFRSSPLTAMRR